MVTYRELGKKLNACARRQMGKALFAFFMLSMLETVTLSFFLAPVLLISKSGKASVTEMIWTALSLYAGFIVILVLQYGYHVLIARLVRGEFVTLGYLFNGFRDRRRIFTASLLYALGLTASLVICQIAAYFFSERLTQFSDTFGLPVFAGLVLIVFVILSLIMLVRFTFVWLCLYDDPQLKVTAAFRKSSRILRRRVFRLIGFILYAGGRRLIIAAVMLTASMVVPAAIQNSSSDLLESLFEFIYMIAAYTATVRMFMSLPVFYDSINGPKVKKDGTHETQEIEHPVIQLPGPSDAE